MAVALQPMPSDAIGPWLAQSNSDHVADLVDSGENPTAATRATNAISSRLFPDGAPAPGQFVFVVVEDSVTVGSVWIGRGDHGPDDAWWLWSIEIHVAARGRGLGRQTVRLAEEFARNNGASTLGLYVFGNNTVARGLYESLGYRVKTVQMSKVL